MSEDRGESRNGQDGEAGRDGWLDRFLHRFNLRSRESVRTDLEDALAEAAQDADFSPHERAMLKNVLGFHRIRVSDVMVPRADIIAVAAEAELGEVLALFRTVGHSRLPVFGETLDEPLGMVHIRDFLNVLAERGGAGPRDPAPVPAGEPSVAAVSELGAIDLSATLGSAGILHAVLFVPRSMPAIDLLVRMQASRTHMALVIDEYGGTDGLVSIEDLVEMVVGDIEDEHDDETAMMLAREPDGTVLADARASLEEVSEMLGIPVIGEEVDTIGGLVVMLVGRVPARGELIVGPDRLEFEVLDADPRRLKRVRIHRRPDESDEDGAAAEKAGSGSTPAAAPASVEPTLEA